MNENPTKRKHVNSLTFKDKLRLMDWLRANEAKLPNLTIKEIVAAANEHLGPDKSCAVEQLRDICNDSHIIWACRTVRTTASPESLAGIQKRLTLLERRFAMMCKYEAGVSLVQLDEYIAAEQLDEFLEE